MRRVALLRTLLHLFVVLDAWRITAWPLAHGDVPAELYRPLLLFRLLHVPAPAPPVTHLALGVLTASALVVAAGRLPRLAGAVCAAAYLYWLGNAFGYSKVDHDHLALLVALCVLPTVGAARGGGGERAEGARSEAAGWALRCVQVAAVCTYFLAALAKVRFGGWDWAGGAVLAWAASRRGGGFSRLLLSVPHLAVLLQHLVLLAEFASPVLLWLRGRALAAALVFWGLFHLGTYLTLGIHFLPTVVCLLAFVPLERVLPRLPRLRGRVPALRR
nr:hypothetical protein [Kineococcus vitellinus]